MKNKKPNQKSQIVVFYDGACGLCAKEINHYRKIAPLGIFEWVDITSDMHLFGEMGYTQEQGLRALHALNHEGEMKIGVDAFILIWAQLPRWHLLCFVVSMPGVYHFLKFLYKHFANWRFKKLGYGACQINKK